LRSEATITYTPIRLLTNYLPLLPKLFPKLKFLLPILQLRRPPLKPCLFRVSSGSFRPLNSHPVFLPLMVTELVSAVKSPGTTTVAPMNRARVLRDTMLLLVANEVTPAGYYFSALRVVADIRAVIDIGTTRCRPPGYGTRHCRSSVHVSDMGRQFWSGGDAGSSGERQLIIEVCCCRLRINEC